MSALQCPRQWCLQYQGPFLIGWALWSFLLHPSLPVTLYSFDPLCRLQETINVPSYHSTRFICSPDCLNIPSGKGDSMQFTTPTIFSLNSHKSKKLRCLWIYGFITLPPSLNSSPFSGYFIFCPLKQFHPPNPPQTFYSPNAISQSTY